MARKRLTQIGAFDAALLRTALIDALKMLDLRSQVKNPVMLAVEIGGILTTVAFIYSLVVPGTENPLFTGMISLWLWLTVLFSNFAASVAEGRGKARAASLRRSKSSASARKVKTADFSGPFAIVPSTDLKKGDLVAVRSGELIPSDGEVVLGAALVNESAITGESAPVVRESGGDRSAVTGGTTVIANEIIIRITAQAGETFLDRMIAMIEGAQRRKTPNEQALDILLFALTAVFLLVVAAMWPVTAYSAAAAGQGSAASLTVLIALFVCLAPTTIAALLPAIAIAGMDRLFQRNIIALSGRAIEAAGDANVLLLDKTGTITLGNREAVEFIPVDGVPPENLVQAAYFASSADETPEGRSVVALSCTQGHTPAEVPVGSVFIPFSAHTRFSGIDIGGVRYRKGAPDAIIKAVRESGGVIPADLEAKVTRIAQAGGTPLVVSKDNQVLGVVYLKDILKSGIRERFFDLRRMGIRTIMITGDNRLTAASIAAEAGVDDFLAEAKPDDKLRLIREYQADGSMVAMTGDGTNDAPALAQADVAVAMNNGTQPAREAANIIDLDSNPTKLLDIVEIGKQILMTRGALTTFSIANDVAKYFAIIPAALAGIYPALGVLNVMALSTSYSAILSAVIFNALVIPFLIPLALRGVQFRPMSAERLLTTNVVIYGFGGVIAPFIGIKAIDLILTMVMPL